MSTDERRYFSEFTLEEQRLGLVLATKVTSHLKREEELIAVIEAAKARLEARGFFDEVQKLPNLDAQIVAQVVTAHNLYFQTQEAAVRDAEAELAKMDSEMEPLWLQVDANQALLDAIRLFTKTYHAEPVIHEDIPQPDQLNAASICALEAIAGRELEATRTLLTNHRPELLGEYEFRVAEEFIRARVMGSVGHAADDLRGARDMLARLRAACKPGSE